MFKAPASVHKQIDQICKTFWWGHGSDEKKMHFIAWDKICAPIENRGLVIKTVKEMNQALLAKQA